MSARPVPHSLDTVRPQLAEELTRLRSAERLPLPDRLRFLADLGSRLAALATYLTDQPELAALARDLEAAERPGSDVDALWRRTVELLTALTGTTPDLPHDTPPPPATPDLGDHPGAPRSEPGRPSWKRP